MISELSYLGLEVKRNMGADSCSSDSGLGPSVLVVHGWQRRNQANNVNHAIIWYRGELEITGHTHGCGEHRGVRVVFWGKSNLRKTNMWSSTTLFFHEYNVTLPSYKFCEGHVVCLPFTLFFSLPLIFTLVAVSISHFLTVDIKFSCFSSTEIRLLCFFTSACFSYFSVINVKILGFGGCQFIFI